MPPVVLGAKEEVYQQDCCGSGSDDHQSVAQEQKPEHVIDLVGPERCHDEVQLHENGAEREDASQEQRWNCLQATSHGRDLPRDLIGFRRALDNLYGRQKVIYITCAGSFTYLLLEPKPATGNAQGHADNEPDQHERKHCAEWHGAT